VFLDEVDAKDVAVGGIDGEIGGLLAALGLNPLGFDDIVLADEVLDSP
jgi:hypothetical protein